MKKDFLFILTLVIVGLTGYFSTSWAGYVDTTHSVTVVPITWAGNATLTVANNATTYRSDYFTVDPYIYSAIGYIANNANGIKLQLSQSDTIPNPQGVANTTWTVPDNMPDIVTNATDVAQHWTAISKVALKYGRIMATPAGIANNSTVIMNYYGQN